MKYPLQYAGFWRRFGAMWLDVVFLMPLGLVTLWGNSQFRVFPAYFWLPSLAFGIFYSVYLVKRFGGTPGKLVAGIRIAKVDGSPVGYREAALREFPGYLLSLGLSLGLAIAATRATDAEYLSKGFIERSRYLKTLAPSWYQPLHLTQTIWIWSEFVVLLTNRKRRAIHDFIAGTVVVRKEPNKAPEPTPGAVTPRATERASK